MNDPDQAPDPLRVMVTLTSGSGVTVINPSIEADGTVLADVAASCSATDPAFTIEVTDDEDASTAATLTVTVTDTTPHQGTCSANITMSTDPGQCGAGSSSIGSAVGSRLSHE